SRWDVATTPACLSTTTGGWRLNTRRTACIWDRKIWKRPISTQSVTPVCGWAFPPTMIWRSTWRWRPAPPTSPSATFSRRKPNRCRLPHRVWLSWQPTLSALPITPPSPSAGSALIVRPPCWKPASAVSPSSALSPRPQTGRPPPHGFYNWQEQAMKDRDFMRYSRQILLEDIAIDGQQKLLASRVLIVGLGGLGAPAALYLA